jgi:exosortase A
MKLVEPAVISAETAPEQLPFGQAQNWGLTWALVLSAIIWVLAWYGDTVANMVTVWARSETFAHGFLIAPLSIWLIWRRRQALAVLTPQPNALALPLLLVVGFAWLMGQAAEASVVQQYSVVLMIPVVVWAILGNQVVRALAFPLFFLMFAVPFGEFLQPMMMEHTADFAVFALQLSGIPVYREGQLLMVPSGNWSVVEACSGLRYLIASLTVGVLYAYLMYRSMLRRLLFVAASVVVPIVANWVRAYLIILIGHLSGMKYAVGVDHLIYGWIFFGVVMVILFSIGYTWRQDREPDRSQSQIVAPTSPRRPPFTYMLFATLGVAVATVLWPFTASRLDTAASPLRAPNAPPSVAGWYSLAKPPTDWTPQYRNPDTRIHQAYANGVLQVGLYIGYYANQRPGAELISSRNMLLRSDDPMWGNVGETRRTIMVNNENIPIIETKLRGRSTYLLVWRWYWVDGEYTVNAYWAKLLLARSRLLGRAGDGAVIVVYAPFVDLPRTAESSLYDFVEVMLPGINQVFANGR